MRTPEPSKERPEMEPSKGKPAARGTRKKSEPTAEPAAAKSAGPRLEVGANESFLRTVLSSMLDPLVAIDVQGSILAASDSVERVLGWKPAELLGQNVNVLIPPPHGPNHDEYLAQHRKTGKTSILNRTRQFDVRRKDGSLLVCDLSVARGVLLDGSAVFIGTFRDVTERKQAEEALRESERRFHALFDQAFQFLGLLKPDGTILEINHTALDATGVERKDVLGLRFSEGPWWSQSKPMQQRIEDAVQRAARGEFVRFEVEVRGRGERLIDVDFSLKPVKDEAGRVVLLIPEGRDISPIKHAQRQETAMLRALAAIGEQAAVLAHEIKNPITAVNLALRAVADQIGEDQQAILEDLVSRMRRLEELMRRTLSFAKPLELRREVIDARELIVATIAHVGGELAKGGAEARAIQAKKRVEFAGDAHHIEEVLSNLIRNAVEAKGIGAHITLTAEGEGSSWVRILVDDDGPGVPRELRPNLFRPFTTTKRKGTGLGLAICKKIVEEHGGTITIEDAPTGGARFVLRFPTRV
jgi:two-component system, LuxR family, sensor kinase FixL